MADGIITNDELSEALNAKTGYKAEVWQTGGGCMNTVLLLDHDGHQLATYLMFPNGGWPSDDPAEQIIGLYNDCEKISPDWYDSEGACFRTPYALTTADEVADWIGGLLARFFTAV